MEARCALQLSTAATRAADSALRAMGSAHKGAAKGVAKSCVRPEIAAAQIKSASLANALPRAAGPHLTWEHGPVETAYEEGSRAGAFPTRKARVNGKSGPALLRAQSMFVELHQREPKPAQTVKPSRDVRTVR